MAALAIGLAACTPVAIQFDQITEVPVATLTALAATDTASVQADATTGPADQAATPADTTSVPSDTALAPTETDIAPTESAPATTTLTLWHTWTDAQLQGIQPELDAFVALHPEVVVGLVSAPDLSQAVADVTAPEVAPDLLVGSTRDLGELARAGRIVPLDVAGVDPAALVDQSDAAAAQAVTTDGQAWAVPFSQAGLALIYNKAAIPPEFLPTNPDDLDDLLQKAHAFKRAFLSQYPLCIAANDAYHLAPIYFGFGLPAFVDDGGQAFLDTPAAIAAGQWLATISPVVSPDQSDELCQLAFLDGTVAMWWTGPESLPAITAAGIDYGILPMGRPYVDVQALIITQAAVDRGHAALVAELIQHLTSAEVQRKLALAGAIIPVDSTVLADKEVAALPSVAGYAVALARGVPLPTHPYADAQWDIVANASEIMWHRAQTPEEALATAQAALVAEIARIAGNAVSGAATP